MTPSFKRRALSAVVMFAVALSSLFFGHPIFDIFILCSGLAMAWEWDGMCDGGRFQKRTGIPLMAGVAIAVLLMMVGLDVAALAVLGVATLVVGAAGGTAWYRLIGPFYIGLPCLALQDLRGSDEAGLMLTLWVLTLVWATDIGGYGFGKTIGGPKLAPRVSPNKTWAGLLGGVLSAAIVGGTMAVIAGYQEIGLLAFGAGLLAIAAQMGDLFESGMKRRFDVKDSSHLIPGHGGVLDRVDGLMIVAPLVVVVSRLV